MKSQKYARILYEYEKLKSGNVLSVGETASYFDVDRKTVRRDIVDLRCYLADSVVLKGYVAETLIYDRKAGGYIMIDEDV